MWLFVRSNLGPFSELVLRAYSEYQTQLMLRLYSGYTRSLLGAYSIVFWRTSFGLSSEFTPSLAQASMTLAWSLLNMADRRRRQRRLALIAAAGRIRRPMLDYNNPLEILNNNEAKIRQHFRMIPQAIMLVCQLVAPTIQSQHPYGMPVLIQVCASLKFFGCGSFFINVGGQELIQISIASAWRSVEAVGMVLAGLLGRYVVFPRGEALRRCQERFVEIGRKNGYPGQ